MMVVVWRMRLSAPRYANPPTERKECAEFCAASPIARHEATGYLGADAEEM